MKVLYDYQAFGMQNYGGVSNCFVKLIENLPKNVEYEIALKESDNIHLKNSRLHVQIIPRGLNAENFISTSAFRGRGFLYNLVNRTFPHLTSDGRNQMYSVELLKRGDFDIFHPTFFNPYFLSYLKNKPFVLTIHDMIPELYYSKKDTQILYKRKLAFNATHLIAVSEKTKTDMIDIWGIPESKITVIYHGAPEIKIVEEDPIVDGIYILYVGQRHTYKRFIPMMRNLLPILGKRKEIKVVCTGPDFSQEEITWFQKNNVYNRVIHVQPDDIELFNLYSNALCFIYSSEYEGFGIPILEAYKASCPVLLNKKSCFPEIAKDAAIYFELDEDCSNLEDVMEQFLQMTDSDRHQLLERQNNRLKDFSWSNSAKKLSEVYQSLK